MMGHIHNFLINMVHKHHGEKGVAKLFQLAGLPKLDFQTEVVYPEQQWQALYRAAKEIYGADDEGAQKVFADYFMEVSPKMFPAIFQQAGSARGLLERVPLIHKQWPEAASAELFKEKLWLLKSDQHQLVYKYDSPNHLCGVLRFVAEGVLAHYKERGTVQETQCALKGAEWCQVEVHFDGTA